MTEENKGKEKKKRVGEGKRVEGERMVGVYEGREGCFLAMRVQEILIPSGEEKERWIGGV